MIFFASLPILLGLAGFLPAPTSPGTDPAGIAPPSVAFPTTGDRRAWSSPPAAGWAIDLAVDENSDEDESEEQDGLDDRAPGPDLPEFAAAPFPARPLRAGGPPARTGTPRSPPRPS